MPIVRLPDGEKAEVSEETLEFLTDTKGEQPNEQ